MSIKTVCTLDYGIEPDTGEDCAAALQALFDGLAYESGTEFCVQFKKGNYHIHLPIRILGAKNLTVRGNRATILAHFDPTAPIWANNNVFELSDCEDTSFHDFFFDTDHPVSAAGRVTSIDRENGTVDLKIYEEFPVTGFEHFCATNSFDEKGTPDYALATYNMDLVRLPFTAPDGRRTTRLVGLPYEVVGEHLVRLQLGALSPALKIGHEINLRYEVSGNTVFQFVSCRRVLLKNIIIYSAASFGATIHPRSEDFTFDNFCIRVPDTSERLMAANADGIHALGLAGKLVLRNCHMENMGDDTLNLHSIAACIRKLDSEKRTLAMFCPRPYGPHSLPEKWAIPGDAIYVYDSETFLRKGSFVIDTIDEENNAVFREETGAFAAGDILANAQYFASLHIDGCTIRSTRARGFLVQTHNVLIENCYFYGMSLSALLFAPDIRVWWEAGPCRTVEIRNNIIEYCAHIDSIASQGAIIFNACHDANSLEYPAGVHEKLFIHDNLFIDLPRSGIFVVSASDVRIEGNRFQNCCYHPQENAEYAKYDIVAANCENIVIRNNKSDRGEETLQYLLNCKE